MYIYVKLSLKDLKLLKKKKKFIYSSSILILWTTSISFHDFISLSQSNSFIRFGFQWHVKWRHCWCYLVSCWYRTCKNIVLLKRHNHKYLVSSFSGTRFLIMGTIMILWQWQKPIINRMELISPRDPLEDLLMVAILSTLLVSI